jgi:hypothetical protein
VMPGSSSSFGASDRGPAHQLIGEDIDTFGCLDSNQPIIARLKFQCPPQRRMLILPFQQFFDQSRGRSKPHVPLLPAGGTHSAVSKWIFPVPHDMNSTDSAGAICCRNSRSLRSTLYPRPGPQEAADNAR